MPSNKKLLQAAGSAGGDNLFVEDVFSTFLYAGSNGARTIANGISLSDEGGLVWLKNRGAVDSHVLFDTVNGPQKSLSSNSTAAGSNYSSYLSFPSAGTAGWNLAGATLNGTGTTWASFSWRKAAGFFDVVTYTGNGTAGRTVAHSLGSAPKFVLVKRTNTTNNWICWHSGLANNKYIQLNSTSPAYDDGGIFWNNTTPDATNLTLGNDSGVNGSGSTYVAYLFGDDAVFGEDGDEQICKMGSYTGNGTVGRTVDFGFEPQWVLIKSSSTTDDWYLFDSMREWTQDISARLRPNTTDEANRAFYYSPPNATGITFNASSGGALNANGTEYIYMAIRRPMKVPEAGTEVFAIDTAGSVDSNKPQYRSGFPVDMVLERPNVSGSENMQSGSRLTQGKFLRTNLTNAEASFPLYQFDYMNGYYNSNTTISSYYAWMFKRASKFMDVVAYTGNGTAGHAINHNLGVAPEMIWVKNRNDSFGWIVGASSLGATKSLELDTTAAMVDYGSAYWNSTLPTNSAFVLGTDGEVNYSSYTYIAYLFATLAGISKVGSVSHSGTTDVNCGFSAGARFVLVKRTDSTSGWYVWDSVRGIVSGNDPYLLLNSTAAQVTNTDHIDPLASGFTLTSSFTAGTYIFLAIA